MKKLFEEFNDSKFNPVEADGLFIMSQENGEKFLCIKDEEGNLCGIDIGRRHFKTCLEDLSIYKTEGFYVKRPSSYLSDGDYILHSEGLAKVVLKEGDTVEIMYLHSGESHYIITSSPNNFVTVVFIPELLYSYVMRVALGSRYENNLVRLLIMCGDSSNDFNSIIIPTISGFIVEESKGNDPLREFLCRFIKEFGVKELTLTGGIFQTTFLMFEEKYVSKEELLCMKMVFAHLKDNI